VGEIVDAKDVTPAAGGWQMHYTVRRDDGRKVIVEAVCLHAAEKTARAAGNELALEQMRGQCGKEAIRFAEAAQAGEGVFIQLWFDTVDGHLCSKEFPPRGD
jgi:hypothetical protein